MNHPRGIGPTITATFGDGPLEGTSVEAAVLEGHPPKTLDVPADDGSTCRYCVTVVPERPASDSSATAPSA